MALYNNVLHETQSDDYLVEVFSDGVPFESVNCFYAPVRHRTVTDSGYCDTIKQTTYCSLSHTFKSRLYVKITPKKPFKTFCVRPFNGICERQEKSILLIVGEPSKISVEFDGDIYENLLLFIEQEKPEPLEDRYAPNVRVFARGIHYADDIKLKDNEIVYFEPGSIVYGCIVAENVSNVRICGYGILNCKFYEHELGKGVRAKAFNFVGCNNVTVEDIIIIDSPSWTLCFNECTNVKIENVKEICQALNSDGADLCSCQDVTISNSFFRVFDDCVSIKASHAGRSGDSRNITVDNCTFWADAAHVLLVGPEANPQKECVFENIVFSNITVLQEVEFATLFQGVMSIFCADNAVMRNITFKNINVDRMDYGRLISIIYTKAYATMLGKKIENIRFENIVYNGNELYGNRIIAPDAEHSVDNVVIKDMYVCGKKQTIENNSFEISENVNGLIFE